MHCSQICEYTYVLDEREGLVRAGTALDRNETPALDILWFVIVAIIVGFPSLKLNVKVARRCCSVWLMRHDLLGGTLGRATRVLGHLGTRMTGRDALGHLGTQIDSLPVPCCCFVVTFSFQPNRPSCAHCMKGRRGVLLASGSSNRTCGCRGPVLCRTRGGSMFNKRYARFSDFPHAILAQTAVQDRQERGEEGICAKWARADVEHVFFRAGGPLQKWVECTR